MTDDPLAGYVDRVRSVVTEHGHMIQGVLGHGHPTFCYTVGLADRWGYELLQIGLDGRTAAVVLNGVVREYPDGPRFGVLLPRVIKPPYQVMVLAPVDPPEDFEPFIARRIAGRDDIRVAQVAVPDSNYLMPWHASYAQKDAQPVVGTPPTAP